MEIESEKKSWALIYKIIYSAIRKTSIEPQFYSLVYICTWAIHEKKMIR